MAILLKQLYAFIKLLNSDTGEISLSVGLALGIILGFAPALSLQFLIVFALCFIFRIQLGAAFLSAFFFKFVSWIVDPMADPLGKAILENESLRPIFATMYNVPLLPLTRFNNSIVMGSMVISFILVIPAFFIFRSLVRKYRTHILSRYKESRFWKFLSTTTIYAWYSKYQNLYH